VTEHQRPANETAPRSDDASGFWLLKAERRRQGRLLARFALSRSVLPALEYVKRRCRTHPWHQASHRKIRAATGRCVPRRTLTAEPRPSGRSLERRGPFPPETRGCSTSSCASKSRSSALLPRLAERRPGVGHARSHATRRPPSRNPHRPGGLQVTLNCHRATSPHQFRSDPRPLRNHRLLLPPERPGRSLRRYGEQCSCLIQAHAVRSPSRASTVLPGRR
jgi:hypothetical protein